MRNLLILASIFFLASCVTQQRCLEKYPPKDSTTIVYLPKDTTIYIPADSSMKLLYLGCYDSLGNLTTDYIRLQGEVEQLQGRNVKPIIIVKDKYIQVECLVDSSKVYLQWKEKHILNQDTLLKEVTTNIVTSWQWFQIWSGRVFFIVLIAVIIYAILKLKKVI